MKGVAIMKKISKAERRAIALKKEKRNKIITIGAFAAFAVVLTVIIIYSVTRPEVPSRVYTTGPLSVTLYANGRFSFVDCNFMRAGIYTETVNGGVITVEFVHSGVTVYGSISGDILTIPNAWDAGKGHDPRLRLQ
jgi:hypothetical protein